jgi:glycosyltransferase involved in cell wall biosynthesis
MTRKKCKVSIIVVSLNTKFFFFKTIKSIIGQSYKNKEIIVVDGKSADGTIKIITNMKKNFSKVIIEKDKGIYDAMNKGSYLAKSEWIMFLNSGDTFYNNLVLANIFKNPLMNKDVIYGDTMVNQKNIKYLVPSSIFSKTTGVMPFCHQSAIVKTDIVKKNKFSLKYKYSSDFDFFSRCFFRKKIFYDSNLTIATVLAKGLSDNSRQKVYSENIKILTKYNYSLFIIAKLWLLKLFNFIKDCIKYILPQNILLLILKFKYRKRLK